MGAQDGANSGGSVIPVILTAFQWLAFDLNFIIVPE